MSYTYKIIQIPPSISLREKDHEGDEAAAYLEKIVNDMAVQGWEFLSRRPARCSG
jgi:hypothetical protein